MVFTGIISYGFFFFLGLVPGAGSPEGPFLLVDFIGKDTKIGNGC